MDIYYIFELMKNVRPCMKTRLDFNPLLWFYSLEKFGGICDCQSTRDTFLYAASVDRRGLDSTIEILGDVVLRPVITEEELEASKAAIRYVSFMQSKFLFLPCQEKSATIKGARNYHNHLQFQLWNRRCRTKSNARSFHCWSNTCSCLLEQYCRFTKNLSG